MKRKADRSPKALAWALLVTGAALLPVAGAAAGAVSEKVQVASSAQLVLDARTMPGKLELWITRTRNHTAITGAGNVAVRLGGRAAKVSAGPGDYVVSTNGLHGGKLPIEVVVAHDGIRELLSGTVTLAQTPGTLERLQKHSTWAWWVLNIGVLLLAARLISRRKKPS